MSISGFFQFILGFILGVLLLMAGSVGAAYYFFNRMASAPPKPVFSETLPEPTEVDPPATAEAESPAPAAEATPEKPEEKPKEKPEAEIPADAYSAKVTWSGGLSLRAEPTANSDRVGGVDYNEEVLVLKESDDKQWQQIRLSDGTEAWVKAGNLTAAP